MMDIQIFFVKSIIHHTCLTIHYLFLETITSSASTGAISINYPSSSSSSSGGSTSVGFFDTLPYIRLEGLTADYLNVLIVILMAFYGLSIFSSYLNLQPLIDQFTGMHFIVHSVSSSNTNMVNVMIKIFHERILVQNKLFVEYGCIQSKTTQLILLDHLNKRVIKSSEDDQQRS